MTSRHLTVIAIKCAALYVIYTAFQALPFWVYFIRTLSKVAGVAGILVSLCIACFCAWLMWRFADSLARDLSHVQQDQVAMHITLPQLQRTLLKCLGLYIVVSTVRPALDSLLRLTSPNPLLAQMGDIPGDRAHLFVDVGTLLVGLSLITKTQAWSSWLWRSEEDGGTGSNQASDATSEPAPGADSSAHQG